jgi:tetratricopeptide (TPR) repeat protein
VSPRSLRSNFIVSQEEPYFKAKRGATICPLIISSVNWKAIDWLKGLEAFPGKDGDAIDLHPRAERNRMLAEFAKKIWAIANQNPTATATRDDFSSPRPVSSRYDRQELARSGDSSDEIDIARRRRSRAPEQSVRVDLESTPEELQIPMLLCALPRQFDAKVLGVLRRRPTETAGNARLFADLCRQPDVHPAWEGGYRYEPGMRERLLTQWMSGRPGQAHDAEVNPSRLDQLNEALAQFYWHRFLEGLELDDPLTGLGQGTLIDPFRPSETPGAPLVPPLPEAIYHQMQRSVQAAYDFVTETFEQFEERGQWPVCKALVDVMIDRLRRPRPDEKVDDIDRWLKKLKYWDARALHRMSRFAEAETLLNEVLADEKYPTLLQQWSWGELADVQRDQRKPDEAGKAQAAGLALAQRTGEDPFNFPVWYSRLADLQMALDEPEQAIRGYRETIRLAGKQLNKGCIATTQLALSEALRQSGDWKSAWEVGLEGLIALRTDIDLNRSGLHDEASLQIASLVAERSPPLLDTLQSEAATMRASAGRGMRLETRRQFVDQLQASGQLHRAKQALAELVRDRDFNLTFDIDLMMLSASLHEDEGKVTTAAKLYGEIANRLRSDPTRAWTYALTSFNLAIQQTELAKQYPDDPDLRRDSAVNAREAKRLWSELGYRKIAALAQIQALLAEMPEATNLAATQREIEEAVAVLAGTPRYEAIGLRALAELLERLKRSREAAARYRQAIELYRALDNAREAIRNLDALAALALPEREQDSDSATEAAALRAQLDAADRYQPTTESVTADDHNARGLRAFSEERWSEARDNFRSAVAAVPNGCWYHLNLAFACAAMEEWSEARDAVLRSVTVGPEWWPVPALTDLIGIYTEKQVEVLIKRCDQAMDRGEDEEAASRLGADLAALEPAGAQGSRAGADLHARMALARLSTGAVAEAASQMRLALERYRRLPDPNPGVRLGRICAARIRDVAHYRAVDTAWGQLVAGTSDPLAADLRAARRELLGFLDRVFQLGPGPEPITIPLPLALEIAGPLIPEDHSTERWALFTRYIPELKERIEREIGVMLPGIRVRPMSTPPEAPDRAEYIALIDEVPVRRGTVPVGRLFCVATLERLHEIAIPPDSIAPAVHPVSGEPGAWLPFEHAQALRDARLEVWDDPLQYVLRDMEATILRNLSRFVDLAEVDRLVKSWAPGDGASIEAALANAGGPLGLRAILRALVEGRVPIGKGQPIVAALQSVAGRPSTSEAVRAIRVGLREVLPGNRPTDLVYRLPADWDERLSRARTADGQRISFRPEEGFELLRSLRTQPGLDHPRAVLVVCDVVVAPVLRGLVEAELPDLMVLAEEEALTATLSRLPGMTPPASTDQTERDHAVH